MLSLEYQHTHKPHFVHAVKSASYKSKKSSITSTYELDDKLNTLSLRKIHLIRSNTPVNNKLLLLAVIDVLSEINNTKDTYEESNIESTENKFLLETIKNNLSKEEMEKLSMAKNVANKNKEELSEEEKEKLSMAMKLALKAVLSEHEKTTISSIDIGGKRSKKHRKRSKKHIKRHHKKRSKKRRRTKKYLR